MGDIRFRCPACSQRLVVDAAGAGQDKNCPKCRERFCIPGDSQPEETENGPPRQWLDEAASFPIFHSLNASELDQVLYLFEPVQAEKGEVILQQGDPGRNFYIVLEGATQVLGKDQVSLATLNKGDVFGEMSLLSGEAVAATVVAMEDSELLTVDGRVFRNMLSLCPLIQLYLATLLAKRLAKSNVATGQVTTAGLSGKLSDMQAVEVFQTLNQTGKSGVLTLRYDGDAAKFAFHNGDLVSATFGNMEGKDAFFETLGRMEGAFQFEAGLPAEFESREPLGDFMWLLMEGLRRVDEGMS